MNVSKCTLLLNLILHDFEIKSTSAYSTKEISYLT